MSSPSPLPFFADLEAAKVPIPCDRAPFYELHGAWPLIRPVFDTWCNARDCLDAAFVIAMFEDSYEYLEAFHTRADNALSFHPDANLVLNCLIPLLDILEPKDWRAYQIFVPDVADDVDFDKLKYYPWYRDTLEELSPPARPQPRKVNSKGKAKAASPPDDTPMELSPPPRPKSKKVKGKGKAKAAPPPEPSPEFLPPPVVKASLKRKQPSAPLVDLSDLEYVPEEAPVKKRVKALHPIKPLPIAKPAAKPKSGKPAPATKAGSSKAPSRGSRRKRSPKVTAHDNGLQVPGLRPLNAETLLMAVDPPSDVTAVARACGNCWSRLIPAKCDYQGNGVTCTPCLNRKLSMCSWRANAEDRTREAEAFGPVHCLSISNLCHKVQEREAWLRQSYMLIDKGERLLKRVKKYGDDIVDIVKTILDQESPGAFGTVYLDRPELEDALRARVSELVNLDPDPSHDDQLDLDTLTSVLPPDIYQRVQDKEDEEEEEVSEEDDERDEEEENNARSSSSSDEESSSDED